MARFVPPDPPTPDPAGAGRLRSLAEARAAGVEPPQSSGDPAELRRLVHELSVHQIELEMQNEELRHAQDQLEASRRRYFDLYHDAPIGYFTVGLQCRIVECNRSGAELLAVPATALINRRFPDFIRPEARAEFQEAWDRLVALGHSQALDLPMTLARGGRSWGHLVMSLGADEAERHPVGRLTLIDISERMRLTEQSARFAAIVTSAPYGIVSCTVRGEVTSWNAGAERLFGYLEPEMIGVRLSNLFPSHRANDEAAARNRVIQGQTLAQEGELLRRDGNLVPVFTTWSPISDSAGRIAGVSFLALDIREQVEARNRLSQALHELATSERALKEADRRKDDFIATLAHELRNPLAPIRNAAAVLRHASGLDRSGEWARDVIERQVGHMAALLEDLLDVSRITRDTITLKIERVDLAHAIGQAIEIVRPQIEARRHELVVSLPPETIELDADATRLTQIFDNLLSNAAKYTDPGGRISVLVTVSDGAAVVKIADTGIGIHRDHLAGVFELFSQVETAIERAQGGLGIGLALVQGLVRKHGGTVEAASQGPGQGSVFTVRLPGAIVGRSAPPSPAGAKAADRGPDPEAGRPLVLVVDDNVDAAESMALMLQMHGYDVLTAHNGETALAILARRHPTAVLLDLGMPGLNGYEVARRIRKEAWSQDVVLIACTGWGQPEDRRRTEEAGFDYHLVKPGPPETVLELLATAVQRNR